jgi:uncharacterized protein DUF4410
MRPTAVFFLAAVVALALTGCIGAYQVAPVSPAAVGPRAPSTPDPDAGLVAVDPGVDMRPYSVLLVAGVQVSPSALKDADDRDLAARLGPLFATEVISRARRTGLFDRVVNLAETTYTAPEDGRALRLEATLTRLNVGSRALRYFVGFGAGASKAQVETRLVDVATGKVLVVAADRREAAFGFFGGDGEDHLRESVSDAARDYIKFLARLNATGPGSTVAGAPTGSVIPGPGSSFASAPTASVTRGAAVTSDATGSADGTWQDTAGAVLKIAVGLTWEFETRDYRLAFLPSFPANSYRVSGTGTANGNDIVLTGRITGGDSQSLNRPVKLTLTRDGNALRGIVVGPRDNLFTVEFQRVP